MAIVNISYDTVAKSLEVKIGDEVQNNITSVSIYKYDEDAHIELVSVETDEIEGMVERTCLYANRTEKFIEPVVNLEKLSANIGKSMVKN